MGQGLTNYAVSEEAIEQNIASRLLSWMYNCFYALTDGIDYQHLMGQQANLEQAIKQQILSSYGVVGITSLSIKYNSATRSMIVDYTINTIFGNAFQQTVEA
jgi:hypothetical protein